MTGKIFDIKRFAVHDGDGIRTTVFMKGCPLHCVWCHNPEGISFKPELLFVNKRCVSCRLCASVCPNHVHIFDKDVHILDRKKCNHCGLCIKECPTGALSQCYREITVENLVKILLEDKDFYEQTNGGITFSGGECLCQADFCAEVMKALKKHSIHCAVDTCGYVNQSEIKKVLDYTDLFLYDLKHIQNEAHIRCTGKSNTVILKNLKFIDSVGKDIEIRIPVIPKMNDDSFEETGKFLQTLHMLKCVKLLPYNNLITSKYSNLGMADITPKVSPPSHDVMRLYAKKLKDSGVTVPIVIS